jgi:hypothetical protein
VPDFPLVDVAVTTYCLGPGVAVSSAPVAPPALVLPLESLQLVSERPTSASVQLNEVATTVPAS